MHDPENKGPGFYIYSSGGVKKSRLEDLCRHKNPKKQGFIPLKILSTEYVVIVCDECKVIQLMDITERRFLKGYQNFDVSFGPVCKGEPKTLYLVAKRQGQDIQSVYILDTSRKSFSEKKVLNVGITGSISTIAYVAGKDYLILFEDETKKVVGVDEKTGHALWQLERVVSGAPYIPKTVAQYFTQQQSGVVGGIIAADGSNKLRVFSTTNGKYKHEINDVHFRDIDVIDCADDTLIVQQWNGDTLEFLLYHVKCEFESSV